MTKRKAGRAIDLEEFKKRARQEIAPRPLSSEDIKRALIKSSHDSYRFTMEQWSRFSEDVLEKPMAEHRFTEAPTTFQIKLFLEWFAQSRTGLLEECITDTTLLNRLNSLKRAIKIHTRYQYTPFQNQEIISFVMKDLIPRGLLSTVARPKPLAPIEVAKDIIRFLFASDEYKHLHPRIRNQMAFAIQLLLFVGVRPGEVVESDAWYQSNEGLLYKDIELVRSWNTDHPGWRLHVTLRNRKGHREYRKHAPVMTLCEEPRMRYMCPVTWFLSLAFADGAFKELESFKDLETVQPVPGEATATQRRTLMGHKYDDTAQYYVSGFIGIDSQSIIHGREQCLELYKESSSMMANRNLLAPKPPGSMLTESPYERGSQMLQGTEKESPEIVSTLVLSATQEYELRRQTREKAYQKDRREYLEGNGRVARATAPTSAVPVREPSRYLLALLKFEPERKAVLDLMFLKSDDGDDITAELPLAQILEPLINMAKSQRKRYTYKTAEPTQQNCCSDCNKSMVKYGRVRYIQGSAYIAQTSSRSHP
ncbi:hypothetical protein E8E11_005165 [Didymella keratinophila]|nr:hypothetical protein E8E11_005165 [Didymella keratinophila]